MWPSVNRPLVTSIWVGVLAGALFGVFLSREVAATRDWPVERARIVAVEDHPAGRGCGRGGAPERVDVTWRSLDPPPGLPATFQDIGACVEAKVGDVLEVVRVVRPDGEAEVFVRPARSYRTAAGGAVTAIVVAFAMTLGLLVARLAVLRLWARRPGPTSR